MSIIEWNHRPELRRPVVVAAFAGWNDAGDAATGAIRHLHEQWQAEPFAALDPEEFYDFTSSRPIVRLRDGRTEDMTWPTNHFSSTRIAGAARDVVLFLGSEPQLRWKTFCTAIYNLAKDLDASMCITLGGMLADVAHSRPTHLTLTCNDSGVREQLGLPPSNYEGPTGIVGVLHDTMVAGDIPSASMWVAVPHYVGQTPSPKAMLALVERVSQLTDAPVSTADLEMAATEYEEQVTELVNADEDAASYVAQLEADDERPTMIEGDRLAAEAERFLRDQGDQAQ